MKALKIVKGIGWALIGAGFIMRLANFTFEGEYQPRHYRAQPTILDGKIVMLFGLIFVVVVMVQERKNKQRDNQRGW